MIAAMKPHMCLFVAVITAAALLVIGEVYAGAAKRMHAVTGVFEKAQQAATR